MKGTSAKETMRGGGKVVQVHIIKIFSVMIGIGKLTLLSENRELTSGELQETVEAIHYHIITQFWDLTGNDQELLAPICVTVYLCSCLDSGDI